MRSLLNAMDADRWSTTPYSTTLDVRQEDRTATFGRPMVHRFAGRGK